MFDSGRGHPPISARPADVPRVLPGTSARVAGVDLDEALVPPLAVDGLRLLREGGNGLLGCRLLLSDLGEHLRDEERVVQLVHDRGRVAGMPRIRRVLLGNRREDPVLAPRLLRILRREPPDRLEAALDRPRPRREVVVEAAKEVLAEAELLVDDVLLCRLLVLGELPDE